MSGLCELCRSRLATRLIRWTSETRHDSLLVCDGCARREKPRQPPLPVRPIRGATAAPARR
jgi:hypothetical protein